MFWQKVHQFDQHLTLVLNSWNSSVSDPIWVFFSDKLVWIPMYAGIIALLFWKLGWKKALVVIAAVLMTFGFCDQFSNLIKHAVGRIRPLNDEFMVSQGLHILERGGGYSFFSAHAANAFGLAASTVTGLKVFMDNKNDLNTPKWLKTYTTWMFFWATMVSISRVFVGRHYLGDVIAGSIIGFAAGSAFGLLATYIIRKYKIS